MNSDMDKIAPKAIWVLVLLVCTISQMYSQSYDYENTALANFLRRHYEEHPFDGLREIADYNNKYLECVVAFSQDRRNDGLINRVAFLKASRMVSEYENGVRVTEGKTIITNDSTAISVATLFTTSGITGKLTLLVSFDYQDKIIYIYTKKVK